LMNNLLYFSMIISGMFLCLTNYWLQYQILLLIPLFILLAYAIQHHIISIYLLIFSIFISSALNDELVNNLTLKVINNIPAFGGENIHFSILPFFTKFQIVKSIAFVWMINILSDLKAIIPLIIFLIIAIVFIREIRDPEKHTTP